MNTAIKVLNVVKKVLRNPVTVRIIASQTGLTQSQVRGFIKRLKV
jgi:DNA-binding IclR family transcriptional regulator